MMSLSLPLRLNQPLEAALLNRQIFITTSTQIGLSNKRKLPKSCSIQKIERLGSLRKEKLATIFLQRESQADQLVISLIPNMTRNSEGLGASTSPTNSLVQAISQKDWKRAIQCIQRHPEQALLWDTVTSRGRRVHLPVLHYACTLRPPISIIRTILETYPEAARVKDSKGRLALHWACDAAGSSPDVIDMLLQANEDGAMTRERKYGFLPLHIACFYESKRPNSKKERTIIVERLIDAYPKGVWRQDKKKWLPLHIAARAGTADIVSLLLKYPSGAMDGDEDGRLPIHLACLNTGTEADVVKIVETLAQKHPESLKKREKKFGFFPLHIACSTSFSSRQLIEVLLSHYPHSVREEDHLMSSPLHVAARANAPLDVIRTLVNAYPDATRLLDKDERLPLHWACHVNASLAVIQTLLDPFSSGVLVEERKYGYTPLHITVQRDGDVNVLASLISPHPRVAAIPDNSGTLPIHVVCKKGSKSALPALKMLLDACPESIQMKDCFDKTPMNLAKLCEDQVIRTGMVQFLQDVET